MKLILTCSRDTKWYFRKLISFHLKEVLSERLSNQVFQEYFYDEMVELLNDEDLMVRLEAIEGVIGVMATKITVQQVEKDLLPVFLRHFEQSEEEECI